MEEEAGSSVRVAVRIRPQLPREIIDACKICTFKTPGEPQAWIGSNKAFTYDFVYDTTSEQDEVYDDTAKGLVEGCFEGFNATILAYGQTGSGKTYTMGTGFEVGGSSSSVGIIPRAVRHLFNGIQTRQDEARENGTQVPEFKVSAQFMELYNEEIIDLFDNNPTQVKNGKKSGVRIHEDANGNIYTVGITSRVVMSEEDTLQCLKSGAFNRWALVVCSAPFVLLFLTIASECKDNLAAGCSLGSMAICRFCILHTNLRITLSCALQTVTASRFPKPYTRVFYFSLQDDGVNKHERPVLPFTRHLHIVRATATAEPR